MEKSNNAITTFPSILMLRIDFSELDYFGHVNNVSFFKYIQAARVNYWDQVGITKRHRETNTGPMLASCKCDFKRPMFYPGQVRILTRIEFIKNTSFSFYHQLLDDTGRITAEAWDVMVMFDFNKNIKVAFPTDLMEIIEKFERKNFRS